MKEKIDYKLFEKEEWTKEEYQEIEKYLKQDLIMTQKLWLYLIKKFDVLKEYISKEDAEKFKHITMSSGAYGYKVICHLLGLKEEYNEIEGNDEYQGAWVMQPKEESIKGEILYFDFASLYPMMYIHANLFSPNCKCCKQEEKWHGNETFKVEGYYCQKQQGKIEELIKDFYLKRKLYKLNKDGREFAIKILLNSLYGISAKPSFKNVYNKYTASDCTFLARQCIAFAIKEFEDKTYDVIYADTDSCIIKLKSYQKEELCKKVAEEISIKISNSFPFPFNEFCLKVDEELKYIQFFKGNNGELNKKHYIYVNKKDKLKVVGLDIIKKDCTELSRKIFDEYLKEQIIKNLDCKFKKDYIDKLIYKIINENKSIIAKRFNIKSLSSYKVKTSIYYLIGKLYGTGEILLIKNYKIGAGKGIKYCSLKEAEKLNIEDLDLNDIYKELSPFIKDYKKNKQNKVKKINQYKLF